MALGDPGPGGKQEHQARARRASAQGEEIWTRRQAGKKGLAAGPQLPGGLNAAPPVLQRHAVPGTAAGYAHPDQTQVPAEDRTVDQGRGTGYWLTFALTRYWPSVTPPNRYFPSVLVLVAAISCSVVTPPTVVTWYRPTKQPATAAPL